MTKMYARIFTNDMTLILLLNRKSAVRIFSALFLNLFRPHLAPAQLTQPHGHDDVEERAIDLEDAGAELVNQLEEHLVLGQ